MFLFLAFHCGAPDSGEKLFISEIGQIFPHERDYSRVLKTTITIKTTNTYTHELNHSLSLSHSLAHTLTLLESTHTRTTAL